MGVERANLTRRWRFGITDLKLKVGMEASRFEKGGIKGGMMLMVPRRESKERW